MVGALHVAFTPEYNTAAQATAMQMMADGTLNRPGFPTWKCCTAQAVARYLLDDGDKIPTSYNAV